MAASFMRAFESLTCRYNVRLRVQDAGTRDKITKLHVLKAEDAVDGNRHERGSKPLEGKTEALSPLSSAGQEKSPSYHSDVK